MQPKTLIPSLFFLFLSFAGFSQDKNPFQSIGKKGKILTLSKGKYEELFDQDSIQQIGTALVNIYQMKLIKLLKDRQEAKRLLNNSTNSKFLSVDPLSQKYPWYTPYQFAGNNPIKFIDLDGTERYFLDVFNENGSTKIKLTNKSDLYSFKFDGNFPFVHNVKNIEQEYWVKYNGQTYQEFSVQGVANLLKAPEKGMSQEAYYERGMEVATVDLAFGAVGEGKMAATFTEAGASISGKYFFRGTSEGFGGNAALQRLSITPTSLDPAVSTIFATESAQYGSGVVYIATAADLTKVGFDVEANVLRKIEKEVAVTLKPLEFAQKASLSVSAEKAREILKGMGINIPAKITKEGISQLLKDTPKMSSEQIETFIKKVQEVVGKK